MEKHRWLGDVIVLQHRRHPVEAARAEQDRAYQEHVAPHEQREKQAADTADQFIEQLPARVRNAGSTALACEPVRSHRVDTKCMRSVPEPGRQPLRRPFRGSGPTGFADSLPYRPAPYDRCRSHAISAPGRQFSVSCRGTDNNRESVRGRCGLDRCSTTLSYSETH